MWSGATKHFACSENQTHGTNASGAGKAKSERWRCYRRGRRRGGWCELIETIVIHTGRSAAGKPRPIKHFRNWTGKNESPLLCALLPMQGTVCWQITGSLRCLQGWSVHRLSWSGELGRCAEITANPRSLWKQRGTMRRWSVCRNSSVCRVLF